ncbi:hypothetical protein SSS_05949 [Sarcoptes scabiei]|uniref:Uncharacterized protein n=1 Tax=Sarcoptes scabiei TaxID=52283 RepID=A0A834RB24_SARSC|nr:hypothetical protein SSS_05949 [Sarcoptes scabiei]
MDAKSGEKDYLSEYKQKFQWNRMMMMTEPKQARSEPIQSQYQISYQSPTSPSNDHHHPKQHFDLSANNQNMVRSYSSEVDSSSSNPRSFSSNDLANDRLKKLDCDELTANIESIASKNFAMKDLDPNKSEYLSKYKNFNEYVYLEGVGFQNKNHQLPLRIKNKARSWFFEVQHRNQLACNYRARSRNGTSAMNQEHQWDGNAIKDRDLQALALAQILLWKEKRSERIDRNRSSSAKPLSRTAKNSIQSAPASIQDPTLFENSNQKSTQSKLGSISSSKTNKITNGVNQSKVDKNNNKINVKQKKSNQSSVKKSQSISLGSQKTSVDNNEKNFPKKIWIKKTIIKPKDEKKIDLNGDLNDEVDGKNLENIAKNTSEDCNQPDSLVSNESTSMIQDETLNRIEVEKNQSTNLNESDRINSIDGESDSIIDKIKSNDITDQQTRLSSPESWQLTMEKGTINLLDEDDIDDEKGKNFDEISKKSSGDNIIKPIPINALTDDLYGPLSA